MILNLGSLAFNANIETGGGTPAWGTELGQGEGYKFVFEDMSDFFTGMVYKSIPDTDQVTCPLGKGGNQRADYDFVIASIFEKVYVNGKRVENARFLLLIVKKLNGDHHVGRRTIKYNPRMTYRGTLINEDCYKKMVSTLGFPKDAAWFVHEIRIIDQDQLHFTAFKLGEEPQSYRSNDERRNAFISRLSNGGILHYKNNDLPLQQIFYGAPGTGKSYKIKKETKDKSVIRTTFHPDSDYSTFVGAYKPVMNDTPVNVVPVVVNNGISLQNQGTYNEKRITYTFVMQAFTKAYLAAWKKMTQPQDEKAPQFLIIEEINRGNCAQIFGDLFQLLDRSDNGFSEYPIEADSDLQVIIKEAFESSDDYKLDQDINIENAVKDYRSNYGYTLSEDVQNGRVLLLPPNLYIWATMNTSDQSLFPIDSAFKRRWDWQYIKIKKGKDESGNDLEWKIDVKVKKENTEEDLLWWDFLQKINEIIASMTSSADKQLGFFFCKADEKGIISQKTFVSKVIFYLWNDVFKDYGFEDASLFRFKDKAKVEHDLTFPDFYDEDGENVDSERVTDFVNKVMNWKKTNEEGN